MGIARRAWYLLAGAAALGPSPVRAELTATASQMHVRTGMVQGSISGAATSAQQNAAAKGFSIANSFDVDVEFFKTSKRSIFIRSTLAYDLSDSRVKYFYVGVGRRWYLGSDGMMFDASDQGTAVSWQPKNRYYLGVDGGISQTLALSLTQAFGEYSTGIEVGAHGGATIPVGKTLGLDVQAGFGYAYGFTSVSVTTTVIRFLVGVSLYL